MADPLPWHDLKVVYATTSKTVDLSPHIPGVTISISPIAQAYRRVGQRGIGRQSLGLNIAVTHPFIELDTGNMIAGLSNTDTSGILFVATGANSSTASVNDDRVFAWGCRPAQNPQSGGPVRITPGTTITTAFRWVGRQGSQRFSGSDYAKPDGGSITTQSVGASQVGFKVSATGGYTQIAGGGTLSGQGIIMAVGTFFNN